ncbi:uncharacterized protein LOC144168510 [Haemaphysalis longicornis]
MAAAGSLCAWFLAALLQAAAAGIDQAPSAGLVDVSGRRVSLPMGPAADQPGLLSINGSLVDVHDSRLPALLLSLYRNMSRLVLRDQDSKSRAALRRTLQASMLESIETYVVPRMDKDKQAQIRQLKFGSATDGFYTAERFVLVSIIVVVLTVSLVVFSYWFVAYIIKGAMRRSPSDIALTELEDLDLYSTEDEGSSAARYNRVREVDLGQRRATAASAPRGYKLLVP